MSHKTPAQLISDYLKGDNEAFEILIAEKLPYVYRYLFRYVYNEEDAQELAQDTFVKVWKKIKHFDINKNFNTWLLTIARNTAIDFLRKKKEIVFSDLIHDDDLEQDEFENSVVDDEPLPSEIYEKQEAVEALEKTLKELPLKYREILILHYREGFSLSEVAVMLKMPLNTVKTRKLRGIKLLRLQKND